MYSDMVCKIYNELGWNYFPEFFGRELVSWIREQEQPIASCLDLACGTGRLSEEFFKLGYDVLGIDYSEEMLNEALEKKYDGGYDIQYICQDMTSFELYGNADIIICALDSINHLNTPEDIRKTIERAFLFTEPGGEKKHLTFDDNQGYGPDFEPLMEIIAKKNMSPIFVCESAGTQDKDALTMKNYYLSVK